MPLPHFYILNLNSYILHLKPSLLLAAGATLALIQGFACSTTGQHAGVSGKIVLSEGWKNVVYLIAPRGFDEVAANYSGTVVDSAVIGSDGRFAFENLPDQPRPALYQLTVQPVSSRYPTMLTDEVPLSANYMPVVLSHGSPVSINAEIDRFQASFTMEKPSPDNEALLNLRTIRQSTYQVMQAELEDAKTPDEHRLLEQEDAVHRFQLPMMAFADSTRSFWAALAAVRWVSPQNDYERVPEFLDAQCRKWSGLSAENAFAAQLCAKTAAGMLPVLKGEEIPDYALPMSTGDTVHLKQLLGAKITILDIWASWCMPCRRENKEWLAPLWSDYAGQGLQIIGYSIDSGAEAWQKALKIDAATWPQASHLMGDDAPLMTEFRISTIPANFILDASGTVIAKNVHGADLKNFIDTYLNP